MGRRKRKLPYVVDDTHRVQFPDYVPASFRCANYLITPLGHVFRHAATLTLIRPSARLVVKLSGGSVSRSLPKAVFQAFGRVKKPEGWSLWVPPDTEVDPATRRRKCCVYSIQLVPHAELIAYGRDGTLPKNRKPIV